MARTPRRSSRGRARTWVMAAQVHDRHAIAGVPGNAVLMQRLRLLLRGRCCRQRLVAGLSLVQGSALWLPRLRSAGGCRCRCCAESAADAVAGCCAGRTPDACKAGIQGQRALHPSKAHHLQRYAAACRGQGGGRRPVLSVQPILPTVIATLLCAASCLLLRACRQASGADGEQRACCCQAAHLSHYGQCVCLHHPRRLRRVLLAPPRAEQPHGAQEFIVRQLPAACCCCWCCCCWEHAIGGACTDDSSAHQSNTHRGRVHGNQRLTKQCSNNADSRFKRGDQTKRARKRETEKD